MLLVDRGPTGPGMDACKFAEKVWNAQQAGAAAVLVANYGEQLTTMTAPDDDDEAEHMFLEDINSKLCVVHIYLVSRVMAAMTSAYQPQQSRPVL